VKAYDANGITIFHADINTSDVLSQIAEMKPDHMITDPPYSAHTHKNTRKPNKKKKGAEIHDLGFAPLDPATRLNVAMFASEHVKRWSVIFTDAEGVSDWRCDLMNCGLEHIRVGAWVRHGAPQITGDRPGAGFDAIEIAHPKGRKRWNGGGRGGVWHCPKPNKAQSPGERHPTEKPLKLYQDLIEDFTDPGDLIVDLFGGSFGMLEVARKLGRRAVGVERQSQWIKRGVDRMKAMDANPSLFAEPSFRQKLKQQKLV